MTDTLDPPEFDEERMLPYSKKLAEGLFLLLDGDAGKMFKFFDMANYLTSEVVEGFYQAMRRQCPASVVDEEILFFLEVCSYVYLHFDKFLKEIRVGLAQGCDFEEWVLQSPELDMVTAVGMIGVIYKR